MQRREFLAASAIAAVATATGRSVAAPEPVTGRQLIELRVYHFATPEKRQAYEQFLGDVMIPALGRAGVAPVGTFKLLAKDNPELKLQADSNDLYVVIPHKTAESFLSLNARLAADQAYQSAGRAVIAAAKADPAYARYDASVMLAFETFPQVLAPAKSESRLAQLRIYESHSDERAARKIHMFNEGGELAIFRKVGMTGVFFGQTLAGAKMPNLTYMLAFDNDEAMKSAWNGFRNDPDWKKLSGDASYKDTVSTITNLVLRPVAGSQI
jgi:hypothetical protein